MATRASYEHLVEIGVFSMITNAYALVGQTTSENYYSLLQRNLSKHIPVIHCTIGGTRNIGSCCVGNKNGLLVSSMCTDQELMEIRNKLPENVKVARIDERLSALGNIVACNDYVALVHPDIDRETQEIIQDTLKVDEVFRTMIGGIPLVGSSIRFTNRGGIVSPRVTRDEMNQLVELLQIPLIAGTVNNGSYLLSAGLIANDWAAFVGQDSTGVEIQVVEKILRIERQVDMAHTTGQVDDASLRSAIIDALL